jgi:hypothetical protein
MSRIAVGALMLGLLCYARADVAVLTQHNDVSRTGANLNETILNVSNVNTNQFGLVFTRAVDDQIYAQPLIAAQVNLGSKGTHNLVIVATVNDSVYAFDADDASVSAPYWQVSFLGPNIVPPSSGDVAVGSTFTGNLGIVGTPVIDPASGTVYVVVRTVESGAFVQRLHALAINTGAERANSPVEVTATYPSMSGTVTFDPLLQNQRAGLALVNGVVYICWTSQDDVEPYHGWVMGYDATNLAQMVVYNDTPNGREGGIWMSGAAPSADGSGNLYLTIANGPTSNTTAPTNGYMVESFVKLTRSGANLNVATSFTPHEWQTLDSGDVDLGSAGLLLIPGTTLAFSGGKEGIVYLVNQNNMGGLGASDNVVQSFPVLLSGVSQGVGEIHGTPVWWNGPGGSYTYIWPSYDYLQQYAFSNGMFALPAFAKSPTPAPATGQPGGILSLSASGAAAGSGILWATHQISGDASASTQPGILHAYNAQNVSDELWNSEQLSSRDAVGNFAKYVPPTVANGKVYLATFSGRLNVYGLLQGTNIPPSATSNWVQTLNFRLTAWEEGLAASFPITTKTILSSLSGLVINTSTGQPAEFSAGASLVRKQPLQDTNDADVRYFVRDGKPAVDTEVTSFFVHSIIGSVSYSTSSHVTGHDIESFSLVNDPAVSFSVQGYAAATFGNLPRSENLVLKSRSANVSGTGLVPARSAAPVVIYGTVSVSGGKLE